MTLTVRDAAHLDLPVLARLHTAVLSELVADYAVVRRFSDADFLQIIGDPNARLLICIDATQIPRGWGFYQRHPNGEVELLLLVTDKTLPRGTLADRVTDSRINVFRALHHAVALRLPDATVMPGTVRTGGTLDAFLRALRAADGTPLITDVEDASNETGAYTRFRATAVEARQV